MPRIDSCPNCFQGTGGSAICSLCGFDVGKMKPTPGALPIYTFMNNRYLVGRTLGKGGFGITYISNDVSANRICAIKEYMPSEYASRDGNTQNVYPFPDQKAKYVFEHGKEKYIEEAKTLIRLINDPIVVDILDYFTCNNTAYLVMEFLDGQDLRKIARVNGVVDPEFAKTVLVTVASSLMEIHRKNILHRDLSPENIIITQNGHIKLIDFGAARNYVSNQNRGMSILLKPGFAPPEQYNTNGVQGPWSDVYALCATFYTIVSGKPLIDALFRYRGEKQLSLYALGCPVTKRTSDVIEKGMELDPKRRYQNFKELLDDIDMQSSPPAVKPRDRADRADRVDRVDRRKKKPNPIVSSMIAGTTAVNSPIEKNNILKIGRSRQSSNMIIDHDTNISRVHCFVRYDEPRNTFFITDAVSANGTYLENGLRLEPNKEYALPPGAKFYLASKKNMLVVGLEQNRKGNGELSFEGKRR